MVKKRKKISKKNKRRISTRSISKIHDSDIRVEKTLIENFVALQKIMVGFSSKFEDLSNNLQKLLDLFETAAKSLAKEGPDPSARKEAETIIKKLDNLADQNKLIARGLTLMHEKNSLPLSEVSSPRIVPSGMMPPKPIPTPEQTDFNMGGGYQKSISEI